MGGNDNELITCLNAYPYKQLILEALSDENVKSILSKEVVTALENIDPDGNPFLLIYSN